MNSNSAAMEFPEEIRNLVDVSKAKYVTIGESAKAFGLVMKHLGQEESTKNFGFERDTKKSMLTAGLGLHHTSYDGHPLLVLIQTQGQPVGTNCSAVVYQTMTLFDPAGDARCIQRFLDHLIDLNEVNDEGSINIYSWHMKFQYWRSTGARAKRSLDSIILPGKLKENMVADLTQFLAPEAKHWFSKHGIPYKRNILLTGPPGTGKSSLILALASHFDRSICFMQPCDKDMTDENFKAALLKLPTNSALVLEDIDSLFSRDRQRLHRDCPLTFSGFLNGLDGLGSPSGQLIMLTTNHVERLDPALVRAGRVDVRAELPFASAEQLGAMFLSFYPGKEAEAKRFAEILARDTTNLSMAAVQNHFIRHRTSDAKAASALSKDEVDLLDIKIGEKKEENEKDEEKDEKEGKEGQKDADEKADKEADDEATKKEGLISENTISSFIKHLDSHFQPRANLAEHADLPCKALNGTDSKPKYEASERLEMLRAGLGAEVIMSLLRSAVNTTQS